MKLTYIVEVETDGPEVDPIEIQDNMARAINHYKQEEGLTGETGDSVISVNVSFESKTA